jgi:SAM-dependent methyltransferase
MTNPSDQPELQSRHSKNVEHFNSLYATHGDSHLTAQYSDRDSQERRFAILSGVGVEQNSSVLDFGCGLGDLLGYLKRTNGFVGQYTGIDLSSNIVNRAQSKYPDATFLNVDIHQKYEIEPADFVLISGIFNIKFGASDWRYLTDTLKLLFSSSRKAMAFNLLSTYVDYFDEELVYFDPGAVFNFCKEELSPRVTVRNDYILRPGAIPSEFTVFVYRTDLSPRKNRACDYKSFSTP